MWWRSKTKWGGVLAGIGMILRMWGVDAGPVAQILDAVSAVLMGGGTMIGAAGLRNAIAKNGQDK